MAPSGLTGTWFNPGVLIVVSGLPGTGKSAVADAVAGDLDAVRLSVDTVDEALLGAGLPRGWSTGVAAYQAVRALAEQNLERGHTVVVDAVNDSEAARDTWRAGATRAGVALVFFLLTLDDPVEHRRRLEGRVRGLAHVREPTWDDVRRQAAAWEPWPDCVAVSAAGPIEDITRAVVRRLS